MVNVYPFYFYFFAICVFKVVFLQQHVIKFDCFFQSNNAGLPRRLSGKESTCNAGDPGLIPGSERSTGEGIGYTLQYSWASLVAQLVKNLPAMRETWVQSLGREDSLEKETATYSSILA